MARTKTDTRIADNGQLDCTRQTFTDVCIWAGRIRKNSTRFLVINKSSHILGYDALFGTDLIKAFGITIGLKNDSLVAKIDDYTIGQEDTVDQYEKHLALVARLKDSQPAMTALDRLQKRYPVFSETAKEAMSTVPMRIEVSTTDMPKAKLRRYSVEDIAEINKQINSMLEKGIIEPSVSQFSSTCHLVPKKTGQKRLVINYIPLNKIAIKDHYPLPQISDLLAHLVNAKYFCALDCTEGFWQIPVEESDRNKTAFITPQGLFQFRRCPFGFTNSPAVFQRAMNEIFKDGLYQRCVIYIDDILVFGSTEEETLANLEWVLQKCDRYRVKLKWTKCEFLQTEVKFLGYKVSQGGIAPLTNKAELWAESEPQTVKEAQGFLGYINYYARFIENYSEKTNVIRRAIRIQPFEWTEECITAKKTLLDDLRSATIQVIPSTLTPKLLDIAVLDNSIEAACLTEKGNLIMRTSAVLSSTQKNYSSLEKELLALIRAYDKFGPFLRGPVTVKSSCTILPAALKLKDKPERIARLLLQLPPDAEFKVEASNNVTQALHRMPKPPDETFYTDGACRMSQEQKGLASWAVIAVHRPELNCSGILKNSSNQRAEIEAVIQACVLANTHKLRDILVVTDSKYVFNAIEKWIDRWKGNGWLDNKHKPVKNEDAFRRLVDAKANLNLNVAHVRGHQGDKYNELADQMARDALLPNIVSCAAIHSPPILLQKEDGDLVSIRDRIEDGEQVGDYFLRDDTLWIRRSGVERLVVPKKQQPLLLQLAHSDPIYGAHYGVKKTSLKLSQYYWPRMSSDITQFVSSCVTCQKNKDSKTKAYGKLMPIKTSSLFNRIHMDIVGPLSESVTGNKYVITAIDAFSRMGFARPCRSAVTGEVIQLLYDEIVSKHGPPEHMVTDNGTQFTSNLFKETMQTLGIKHSTTCEYNPKANGMDEKFNGNLMKIVRNYVGQNQKGWDQKLAGAVLAYNITPNESTTMSPYTIVYGRLPRSPLNPTELEIDTESPMHDDIREAALEHMEQSHDKMISQYDKSKQDFDFKPLDLIMVKTLSVGRTDSRKLASKWTGPHCLLRYLEHDGVRKAIEILDSDSFKVRRVAFGAVKPYITTQQPMNDNLPGQIITSHLTGEREALRTNNADEPELRTNSLPVGLGGSCHLQIDDDRPRGQQQAISSSNTNLLPIDYGGVNLPDLTVAHKGVQEDANPLGQGIEDSSGGYEGVNPSDPSHPIPAGHESVNLSDSTAAEPSLGVGVSSGGHKGVNPLDPSHTAPAGHEGVNPSGSTAELTQGVDVSSRDYESVNLSDLRHSAPAGHGGVNPPGLTAVNLDQGSGISAESHEGVNPSDERYAIPAGHGGVNPPDLTAEVGHEGSGAPSGSLQLAQTSSHFNDHAGVNPPDRQGQEHLQGQHICRCGPERGVIPLTGVLGKVNPFELTPANCTCLGTNNSSLRHTVADNGDSNRAAGTVQTSECVQGIGFAQSAGQRVAQSSDHVAQCENNSDNNNINNNSLSPSTTISSQTIEPPTPSTLSCTHSEKDPQEEDNHGN